MADHSSLLSQQNGYSNGSIDPSVLLLDPNPPSSRLQSLSSISITVASAPHSTPFTSASTLDSTPSAAAPPLAASSSSVSASSAAPEPSQPSSANHAQRFMRPFTFSEALPYSPFSSISPLQTGVIPIPSLASKAATSQLAQLVSQDDFQALNANAVGIASPPSDRSLDDVYQLLANSRLPQFNFKPFPQKSTENSAAPPSTPAMPASPSLMQNLQPISRMILNKANVPFRYPSPESPHVQTPNGNTRPVSSHHHKSTPTMKRSGAPSKPKESAVLSSNAIANAQAHTANLATIEISIPNLPRSYADCFPKFEEDTTDSPAVASPAMSGGAKPSDAVSGATPAGKPTTPPSQQALLPPKTETSEAGGQLVVELKSAPEFNPQEYQTIPEAPEDTREDAFGDLDQRQRAEAAFQELFRLFQDIFEEEANPMGQSGALPLITLTSENEPTLTDTALRKAQSAIQKTITLGCFADVPLEDLLRLQRLCDGSLKSAAGLDLKLSEEATESAIDEWVAQLRYADTGLKAARLSLKIMSGGREDKQLYSENVIQGSLDLFRRVMDNVVVPIAELRSSGPLEKHFKYLVSYKKAISPLFMATQRLFSGMAALVASIDLSDMVVNALEFSASHLIFVENAHTERDSVLGVQAFDGLRLAAMDMLSQIFVKRPAQRRGIFDDILTSLEKLPVGKQKARQFKLADGRSIQPVSALIMRLVQASAGRVSEKDKVLPSSDLADAMADEDELQQDSNQASGGNAATITSEEQAAYEHDLAIAELTDVITPLNNMAYFHAKYVIKFIVQRAQTSSKSADTPYRNLLDLFVEDFTACLENPDWPAAELLLRLLMMAMFKFTENEKIPAPVKNMALEELGVIGAALARLRSVIHKSANSPEAAGPEELDRLLSRLASAALAESPPAEEFLAWTGPYRSSLEYLEDRSSQDPHLRGAISYAAADWASRICRLYNAQADATAAALIKEEEEGDRGDGGRAMQILDRKNKDLGRISYRLRVLIEDGRGMLGNRWFQNVSAAQAKLSYALVTLRSPLGGAFNDIINILAMGMGSDQATVRSKSLKSIADVLETDPSIFDNPASIVGRLIRECCADSSVQVRDSALGLVSRAITLRPQLEETMIKTIIDRFLDSGVGVRKRAIKVARDVYLRNPSREMRSSIANGLLHRIQDPDEGVRDLARQTIEEVWVTPFAETVAADAEGTATSANKTYLADHVTLILQTVKTGSVTPILDKVFQAILSPTAKAAATNFGVCKRIVESMFDLVDNPDSDDPTVPSGREALQLMMIFAKADPRLFTFEQIRLLKPYVAGVKDVQTVEDMAVARAVVVIYRRVLPQLSSAMKPFLEEIRSSLLPSVVNVSRTLLDDVVGCLWAVSVLLKDPAGLVRIVLSALRGVQTQGRVSEKDPLFDKITKRFTRYALIVGMVGKHCDLDSQIELFKKQFPSLEATTVSKLMVDILCPFSVPPWPLPFRRIALDAMGLICQSWPRNFVLKNVYTSFHLAFNQKDPSLEVKIMQSLKEFLTKEEQRSETAPETTKTAKAARGDSVKQLGEGGGKRQLTVMGGTNHDDVASATTQRFLGDITRIALESTSEEAYLAAEILGSISRQGLVHPKETGVTLITLETSTMPKLSEMAYREHRALHNKYESVLEREYMKAVHMVYKYQRDVVRDARGATPDPFTSKLHHLMDVVKDSKSKNRGRLLEKLCGQIDFDPAKLDVSQPMPQHLGFARFVVENLAFVEYVTVGELQATVSSLEKMVHTTGVTLVQAIEAEVFEPATDRPPLELHMVEGQEAAFMAAAAAAAAAASAAPSGSVVRGTIDSQRLRQLAAGCMVLLCAWEARSYLCRQYGLKRDSSRAKAPTRDLTRSPTKIPGVTGDKFWEEMGAVMAGLDSREFMIARCKGLVELLTVDAEFKIEEDSINDEDPATPSGEEDEGSGGGLDRGRKRKAGNGGTPGRKKKRQRSSSQQRKRGRPRKNVEEEAEGSNFDSF